MHSALLDYYWPGYHILWEQFLRCDHNINKMDYEFNITHILDKYKQFTHVMQNISIQNYSLTHSLPQSTLVDLIIHA